MFLLQLELIDWSIVSENHECSGSEIFKTLQSGADISDCADECRGVSSMFLFRDPPRADCYCETAATPEGTCDVSSAYGYHLYKYDTNTATPGKSLNT